MCIRCLYRMKIKILDVATYLDSHFLLMCCIEMVLPFHQKYIAVPSGTILIDMRR